MNEEKDIKKETDINKEEDIKIEITIPATAEGIRDNIELIKGYVRNGEKSRAEKMLEEIKDAVSCVTSTDSEIVREVVEIFEERGIYLMRNGKES